jgi:predicted DNA-binding transcriptional regulator YafY
MSGNKDFTARIRVINECLANGGYWTKNQLLDKIAEIDIEISARTLDSDLQLMRSSEQLKYYAPIKYCRTNEGYYYTDSNYSIDKLPLKTTDIKALSMAVATLQQYSYIPIMKEFAATIDKVIRVVKRAKQVNNADILTFIEFEKTPVAKGIEHINTLIDAILDKLALNLVYCKFGHPPSPEECIHPYFLKEYRNRWYVIAFNSHKNSMRTYGLDRIQNLQLSSTSYIPNTFKDNAQYLGDCIGINKADGKIEIVRLRFSKEESPYIKTQPLHKSQKVISESEEGVVIFEYNLIINYELISIILGYGPDVLVLQPTSLVKEVYTKSKRTMELYDQLNH